MEQFTVSLGGVALVYALTSFVDHGVEVALAVRRFDAIAARV